MSRVFLRSEVEAIATYWRIARHDGVTLGFTSHNRDLVFDGLRHRAAPGMVPSAIRRDASLESELLEVEGVLSHDAICAADLAAGRFDLARVTIGVADWETLDHAPLFEGTLGAISATGNAFEAELRSAKDAFLTDLVPRTSPTCRAAFCGADCQLNAARFTHLAKLLAYDETTSAVSFLGGPAPQLLLHGFVRWLDGPLSGIVMPVADLAGNALILDAQFAETPLPGTRALLREGCDHTLSTCAARFANTINFRGEPYLPGNDLLARYPTSAS